MSDQAFTIYRVDFHPGYRYRGLSVTEAFHRMLVLANCGARFERRSGKMIFTQVSVPSGRVTPDGGFYPTILRDQSANDFDAGVRNGMEEAIVGGFGKLFRGCRDEEFDQVLARNRRYAHAEGGDPDEFAKASEAVQPRERDVFADHTMPTRLYVLQPDKTVPWDIAVLNDGIRRVRS